MKNIFNYIIPTALLLPVFALAQDQGFNEVDDFVQDAGAFINDTLIPILLAVAFLLFIWGLVQFFLVAGDDNSEAKAKGKSLMLWGIFAFVIIVSIWGIVELIANGLNLGNKESITPPRGPTIN